MESLPAPDLLSLRRENGRVPPLGLLLDTAMEASVWDVPIADYLLLPSLRDKNSARQLL